ncbi:hypothetical protein J7T55_011272 [Diaporthe amygdali]|uniref:uncharacterized protein n=1 Tax=Phomopsis amygdali TaxID=1214568 RepID=UPI0022FE47A2|nr:uncharacterized protein J7T55_011272 [Diaporthe amygdali]KAJ0108781.1 hypothetical protein J7T55_011272 [Diaporthe amygdali]
MSSAANTDFLVVGSGPAGAALGAFLGQNGLKGLVISSASCTADTPRAHVFNPFGMECLRDLGLEDDALSQATRGQPIQAFRWCRSMVGEEYGRVYYWGSSPDTMGDTNVASPCEWTDLPQSYLDPLLVKFASHHGFEMRFSTKLVGVRRASNFWACEIQDLVTNIKFELRAKYIFGADGARSTVARSLNFEFTKTAGGGVACNILLKADLDHIMHPARQADLHWIMKPDQKTRFGISPTLRMIRPWKQWMLIAFTPGATEDPFKDLTPKSAELIDYIRELIGDDSVDIEVQRLDPWVMRDSVAIKFSREQSAFILGDAAHHHPPAFGLGSNTCIQDAYNLGWKIAYVEKGLAGRGLLDSYDAERQPVGANVVKDATYGLGLHSSVWEALGMFAETPEQGMQYITDLSKGTPEGAASRARLHASLEGMRLEAESLGATGNQWYISNAVFLDDESGPRPPLKGNRLVQFHVSTYPGTRLPHAWLDQWSTRRKKVSTQDIAGKGSFCLLTGHGGDAWKQAADKISQNTGIPINSYGIGFGLDYHDVYREWYTRREIEDDGCVLVRPDRFVAWRSMKMVPDCESKLSSVLDRILSRDELS